MITTKTEDIVEQVHRKREAGFNCAEGVFWGITRKYGLDWPISCVTGFGGGMGGTGSVCGALTGAIGAIGMYFGRTEPDDNDQKIQCNSLCAKIFKDFQEAMESELCREILGYLPGKGPAITGINPKCQQAVVVALQLALDALETVDKS